MLWQPSGLEYFNLKEKEGSVSFYLKEFQEIFRDMDSSPDCH